MIDVRNSSLTSPTTCPALPVSGFSLLLTEPEPSMPSLCDVQTGKRQHSPHHFGQYQFFRMPFGLSNVPATYSRLVARALRHLPSSEVLCYLDDTAVHSQDAWSHLCILRKVLAAFRAAGLQISPGKAQLFRDHIKYLGHEIIAHGISIPPEYTSVVKEWPISDTLKTLRAFLGNVGTIEGSSKTTPPSPGPSSSTLSRNSTKGSLIFTMTLRPSAPSD